MSFQGDYDPGQFVEGSWGTYPPITSPAGATLYQPGMWWRFDRDGTFNGIPVETNDQLYVDGRGRLIGDLLIGSYLIGGDPFDDWPVELTSWIVRPLTEDPWQDTPPPFSGELIGDTGWRAVVEVLHNHTHPTGWGWVDWTDRVASVSVARGAPQGSTNPLPVDTMVVELIDPLGPDCFYRVENDGRAPRVASPIRLGVFDPDQKYHPLGTCRIEAMSDDHDQPSRLVTVEAFGILGDVVSLATTISLPREGSTARLERYWSEIGLDWGPVDYPTTPGIELASQTQGSHTDDQLVRWHADMIARLNAWIMENDARGRVRFVDFPRSLSLPHVDVTDQAPLTGPRTWHGEWTNAPAWPDELAQRGDFWTVKTHATLPNGARTEPGDLLVYGGGAQGWIVERPDRPGAVLTRYRTDLAELVNDVLIIGDNDSGNSSHQNAGSIADHGRRAFGWGMPWLVAEPQSSGDLAVAGQAVLDRAAWIRDRVVEIGADTATDPTWLEILATVDLGWRVTTHRQGDTGAVLLGQVCGIEHRLDPHGWAATLNTTGIVPADPTTDTNARTPAGVDIRTPSGTDVYVPAPRDPEYPT